MVLQLYFLAPIPVGSEVVVVYVETSGVFGGWGEARPMIVVDRATSIVYADDEIDAQVTASDLAVETYTNSLRRSPSKEPLVARVTSCLVRTRGSGKSNDLNTVLGLEPIEGASAYR